MRDVIKVAINNLDSTLKKIRIEATIEDTVAVNSPFVFTEEDLRMEVIKLEKEYEANKYKEKRQAEYPPITDYLDGIVKGDKEQVAKYISECLAVKTKYPKGDR